MISKSAQRSLNTKLGCLDQMLSGKQHMIIPTCLNV